MAGTSVDLEAYAFFKGLERGLLKELSRSARTREFKDGESIFKTGGKAEHLYVILEGKVNLLSEKLASQQDVEPVATAIRSVGPGEIVGWSWLVAPYQWRFDAEAVGKTVAIEVDGAAFRGLCEANPAFGYDVLQRLTRLIVDRLYAAKFQMSMHSGKPYSSAEGA